MTAALLALLALFGHHRAPPPIVASPPAPLPPLTGVPADYHAVGGWRPTWRLDIVGGQLRFQRGKSELTIPAPAPSIHYNGLEWAAEGAFGGIKVEQFHERCLGHKGTPYGDAVRVTLNKVKLLGCGGTTPPNGERDVLDGGRWRLHTINDQPIGHEADVTLVFARGRVIGRDGCNAFGATYTLKPATLHFDTAISTEVACSPGNKAVEKAAFSFLGQTMAVRQKGTELILVAQDGRVARFRLQDPRKFEYAREWRRKPVK